MKKCRWIAWIALFFLGFNGFAQIAAEPMVQSPFFPTSAPDANWLLVGNVTNEVGDEYHYFFQMTRRDARLHVQVGLFDAQTKTPLFVEEGEALLQDALMTRWQVGRAFLRFNPINASLIFGVKEGHKRGFNFKVDMLSMVPSDIKAQSLRPGLTAFVVQTGEVEGHLQTSDQEQFVTAKKAWLRQIASIPILLHQHLKAREHPLFSSLCPDCITHPSEHALSLLWSPMDIPQARHDDPLKGLVCQWRDGRGLYALRIMDSDAVRGSMVGLFDTDGKAQRVSQFINVYQSADGAWHVDLAAPKSNWTLNQPLQQGTLFAGFLSNHTEEGFCVLNEAILR